jgi:hypothetical protein
VSSTARGGKRSPADFYGTPAWPVHRLLEALPLPGGLWLEPAGGEGAIIKAVNEVRSDVKWAALELRPECAQILKPLVKVLTIDDTLQTLHPIYAAKTQVSISNYPFSLAMDFIKWNLASPIPYVISLLRLNYVGTEKRNDFFVNNMPDVYVIPDRVSFAKSLSCESKTCDWAEIVPLDAPVPPACPVCGSKVGVSYTDSIEYAWFVWGLERNRKEGKIRVLKHTPLEQR